MPLAQDFSRAGRAWEGYLRTGFELYDMAVMTRGLGADESVQYGHGMTPNIVPSIHFLCSFLYLLSWTIPFSRVNQVLSRRPTSGPGLGSTDKQPLIAGLGEGQL